MADAFAVDADMANALEQAYAVARQARLHLGSERQDAKVIEECCELARALAQRQVHYRNGGKRGDVDEEAADVLLTVLGLAPPGSDVWVHLRAKTARLKGLLEQGAKRRG